MLTGLLHIAGRFGLSRVPEGLVRQGEGLVQMVLLQSQKVLGFAWLAPFSLPHPSDLETSMPFTQVG